jgi:hypothetical protein
MVRDQHLAERAVPVARDEAELDRLQPLSGGRNCTTGKNFTGQKLPFARGRASHLSQKQAFFHRSGDGTAVASPPS